jgi:hypothetical protein
MVEKIRGDKTTPATNEQQTSPDSSKIMQDASDQPQRSPYGEIN